MFARASKYSEFRPDIRFNFKFTAHWPDTTELFITSDHHIAYTWVLYLQYSVATYRKTYYYYYYCCLCDKRLRGQRSEKNISIKRNLHAHKRNLYSQKKNANTRHFMQFLFMFWCLCICAKPIQFNYIALYSTSILYICFSFHFYLYFHLVFGGLLYMCWVWIQFKNFMYETCTL